MRARVIEALNVVDFATDHHGDDAVYGLSRMMDWLDGRFEEHESDRTPWTGSQFPDLLADTACVVALISDVNNRLNCQLLHAANTILIVALEKLNEADGAAVGKRKEMGQ